MGCLKLKSKKTLGGSKSLSRKVWCIVFMSHTHLTCVPCIKNNGAMWNWQTHGDTWEWAIYETKEEALADRMHAAAPESYKVIEVEL